MGGVGGTGRERLWRGSDGTEGLFALSMLGLRRWLLRSACQARGEEPRALFGISHVWFYVCGRHCVRLVGPSSISVAVKSNLHG